MSTGTVCRACMRAVRQVKRISAETRHNFSLQNSRSFFIPLNGRSHPSYCPEACRAYATTATSVQSSKIPLSQLSKTATSNSAPLPDAPASPPPSNRQLESYPSYLVEPYVANSATETLLKECARQADYFVPQAFKNGSAIPKTADGEDVGEGKGPWYEHLGLVPTFSSWAQVTFLHMYLITVRLRYFPADHAQLWMQLLHNHFFFEAEHRMNIFHGLSSRGARNKHLKDLYDQWRGVLGAYDEGLVKGDAVLGAAVWRNVFKGQEEVDWRRVALVVSFMRRALRGMDQVDDEVVVKGLITFANPMTETAVVGRKSQGVNEPFTPADEEELEKFIKENKDDR